MCTLVMFHTDCFLDTADGVHSGDHCRGSLWDWLHAEASEVWGFLLPGTSKAII